MTNPSNVISAASAAGSSTATVSQHQSALSPPLTTYSLNHHQSSYGGSKDDSSLDRRRGFNWNSSNNYYNGHEHNYHHHHHNQYKSRHQYGYNNNMYSMDLARSERFAVGSNSQNDHNKNDSRWNGTGDRQSKRCPSDPYVNSDPYPQQYHNYQNGTYQSYNQRHNYSAYSQPYNYGNGYQSYGGNGYSYNGHNQGSNFWKSNSHGGGKSYNGQSSPMDRSDQQRSLNNSKSFAQQHQSCRGAVQSGGQQPSKEQVRCGSSGGSSVQQLQSSQQKGFQNQKSSPLNYKAISESSSNRHHNNNKKTNAGNNKKRRASLNEDDLNKQMAAVSVKDQIYRHKESDFPLLKTSTTDYNSSSGSDFVPFGQDNGDNANSNILGNGVNVWKTPAMSYSRIVTSGRPDGQGQMVQSASTQTLSEWPSVDQSTQTPVVDYMAVDPMQIEQELPLVLDQTQSPQVYNNASVKLKSPVLGVHDQCLSPASGFHLSRSEQNLVGRLHEQLKADNFNRCTASRSGINFGSDTSRDSYCNLMDNQDDSLLPEGEDYVILSESLPTGMFSISTQTSGLYQDKSVQQ
ncbi:hypothetical protein MP228_011490 [Amoeboaphelidium protococcarum]|nr:hypothetical protein MP228_011490 [Amoeboaphelidium protococcarum]